MEIRSFRTYSTKVVRIPDDDTPSQAEVNGQLRQAKQALSDAEGAQDAELSDTVVINRLYYACFHAAQAVLYYRGHSLTTHGGVLTLFSSEIVGEGDAPREDGRFLNDLGELRKQADYDYGSVNENVDEILAQTRQFVSKMASLALSS